MITEEIRVAQTVIEPAPRWLGFGLSELWRARELLVFLAWRDVKVRYKQTVLGGAWAVLQPLLFILLFTVIFGRMARVPTGGVPYPLFVCAGLIPWIFFSTAVNGASQSIIRSERMITKIYFPRLAVPLSAIGASLVDLAISFLILFAAMAWYGVPLSSSAVLLPLALLLTTCAAAAAGIILSALTVAYRDFRYIIPFLLQFWLFATPSVYMNVATFSEGSAPAAPASANEADPTASSGNPGPAAASTDAPATVNASSPDQTSNPRSGRLRDSLPPFVISLLNLNPMTGLIAFFRAAVLGLTVPWAQVGMAAVTVFLLLIGGVIYFRRVEDSFADIV